MSILLDVLIIICYHKSMKEESSFIARLIINNAKIKYCSLCLGVNGTWCGEIHAQQKCLSMNNPLIISLKKVSKYAN